MQQLAAATCGLGRQSSPAVATGFLPSAFEMVFFGGAVFFVFFGIFGGLRIHTAAARCLVRGAKRGGGAYGARLQGAAARVSKLGL